jgi:hypothetical protein
LFLFYFSTKDSTHTGANEIIGNHGPNLVAEVGWEVDAPPSLVPEGVLAML